MCVPVLILKIAVIFLDDSRDYVDAIVRESDDDYKYYGKHLSDAEIESLSGIIKAYAE